MSSIGLTWVRMPIGFADLLPQKRLRALLRNPLAAEYVRRLWEHCSAEQISGVIPTADVELAADWEGAPGAFVTAAIAAGVLVQEAEGCRVVRWTDENKAAIEKVIRDRQRLHLGYEAAREERQGGRGPVAEGIARDSRETPARLALTNGRTNGRTNTHTRNTASKKAPPQKAAPPSVCVDFQKQKTNVPAPRRRGALALSEAEEPEERPPLRLVPGPEEALEQEVVLAWQAYQRLEPDAELTPKRKRLLVAAIRRRGPDVRRSFEGRAGAPSTKLDLLPTLPGLLEDERISKGVALRRLPGWKDPNAVRPKPAEPPPAAPALSAGHVTAILASLPEAPWRTKRRPGTKQEER